MFRSILVPLKAAIMNLLSIGAAYGVIVAIFQWGWGKELVGVGKEGPIQAFLPIMMFAILFGLSMDYEVFLLSRIRRSTCAPATTPPPSPTACRRPLGSSPPRPRSCAVLRPFVLGDNIIIKLFGIGFASAIFIDATLIRMVIVPSTMELLGDAQLVVAEVARLAPTHPDRGRTRPRHRRATTARIRRRTLDRRSG